MGFLDIIAPHRAILRPRTGTGAGTADLRLRIGPVVLPYEIEPQHDLVVGATGAGKTVVFHRLAWIISQRPKDRMVVLDPEGSLFSRIGRDGDTTANIFDHRAPLWDPSAEIREEADVDFFSLAIFPRGQGEVEDWYAYGRSILKSILLHFPHALPSELYRHLFLSSPAELKEICAGTPAQRLFEPGAERMLSSTLGVMASRLEWLRHLRDPDRSKPVFTFSGWARSAPPGARLFLPYSARQRTALIPFYGTATTLIINSLLSLPPVPQPTTAETYRRTWIIADEFGALGRIGSVEDALTNGRRFGAAVSAGVQDIHQLRIAYGGALTGSILNSFGTWLVMGMNDGESADYFSRALGNTQMKRRLAGTSENRGGDHNTSSTSINEQIQIEPAVLAGELLHLPNLEGFLRVRGDPFLHHITVPVFSWSGPTREWFIPRLAAAGKRDAAPVPAAPAIAPSAALDAGEILHNPKGNAT